MDVDGTMTEGSVYLICRKRKSWRSRSKPLTPTTDKVSRWQTPPRVSFRLKQSTVNPRILGTTSGQLGERKNGALAPKRHQMKYLEF